MGQVKLISFNVNGLRSVLSKQPDGTKHEKYIENNTIAFLMDEYEPDVLCLQEIRCSDAFDFESILKLKERGYQVVKRNCANKAGYSGTLVLSRLQHLEVIQNFPHLQSTHELNTEGRLITVEYPKFVLMNAYVPNSKPDLSRLEFRTQIWEHHMRQHIKNMEKRFNNKPIVYCADFNVAPMEIDVHGPKTVKGKNGFTKEERSAFVQLLEECNLVDTFRTLHPIDVKYSWWSNFAQSREKNKGWRIDTFLVSASILKKIKEADIYTHVKSSDHAPVVVELNL